jgi:hypothetical protein
VIRSVNPSHPRGYVDAFACRKMGVAQGIGKFILAARHKGAPCDASGQKKFESLAEAGLPFAVGSPHRRQLARKHKGLFGRSKRPKPLDAQRFNS